ncbi:MAG: DUF177 domain-containing protein [Clostridia bacterium]
MLLDVSRALQNPGQSYPFEGELVLPEMTVLDDLIEFESIQIKGRFTGAGDSVSVSGHVTAVVHAHCASCLSQVAMALEADTEEHFARSPDPNDPDRYPLVGHTIELTGLVKDALLLEMPMRFLCDEQCKGLCPVCGVNRNNQRCTCQEGGEHRPNPFSALSGMLSEDEEV